MHPTTYEPVIGLEVHAELQTRSKMFCSCPVVDLTEARPNEAVCPICAGMPGVLPVLNRRAVEYGVRVALALECQIETTSIFERKNYFYPDLPKGYQISQYDEPLCFDGVLKMAMPDGSTQPCSITRAHLEEDAGKSIHMESSTLVDLNRAGTPLIEIVGGPDLRSPEEAYIYLNTLKRNLSYLGVSDLSMEKGSLRCDANVSIRPKGQEKFGVRSEIKNLNSFRMVRSALEYEIKRHTKELESGGSLRQDTRLWDDEKLETRSMRSKEEASDYRFFPEPDLATFDVPRAWVEAVRATLPEMPEGRLLRFLNDYKLTEQDAVYLVGEKTLADFYEAAVGLLDDPKKVAAWVVGEVTRELNDRNAAIEDLKVTPETLVELIKLLDAGRLNNITAKEVFHAMVENGSGALETAKKLNKLIVQDDHATDTAIDEVIKEFADAAVADFKAGEQKALGFLIGQVMRKLKGKANPKELGAKISKRIKGQEPNV